MYPSEYRYSREHEWVLVEGDVCTVGITHFAQEELGEVVLVVGSVGTVGLSRVSLEEFGVVVFVGLPEVGHAFDTMDGIGFFFSVTAAAELYTPVAGEIIEVNKAAADDPAIVNDDPHGEG